MALERLIGKVAIITGAAGGIGAATAKRFVQEGARVALADINAAQAQNLAAELGEACLAIEFDQGDRRSIEQMIAQTVRHFGRLDVLHNNAAALDADVMTNDVDVIDTPLELWDRIMMVNASGCMACCKYALPHMLAAGGGSIINMSSGSALAGDLGRTSYGASKAAVIALSQYIATQYGSKNIRCNSISPGVILTGAVERGAPGLKELIQRQILTPRFGTPEDVAALVTFLASDESGYITAQNISINGGSLSHQPHTADLAIFLAQADEHASR